MKRRVNILQILYGCAVVLSAAMVIWLAVQGVHAKNALCALQGDLKERVTDTRAFVHKNGGPSGYAVQGISNKALLSTANSQEKTAKVLDSELNCPNPDK